MKLNRLNISATKNTKNSQLSISLADLLENFNTINISQIQHLINVKKDEIGYTFYLDGKNIGNLVLSKKENEITWIDNINGVFKRSFIKGLGYFMIRYAIKDILNYKNLDKFYIYNVLGDVENFYKKVVEKLQNENIIKDYNWIGNGTYKDLVMYL